MQKHILYVGLNDKDSKVQEISILDAYKIVQNVLIGVGYDGGNIQESTGFYRHESGEIVIEKSLRVELCFADDKKTSEALKQIKQVLNQESIILEKESKDSYCI